MIRITAPRISMRGGESEVRSSHCCLLGELPGAFPFTLVFARRRDAPLRSATEKTAWLGNTGQWNRGPQLQRAHDHAFARPQPPTNTVLDEHNLGRTQSQSNRALDERGLARAHHHDLTRAGIRS